jgi:hypothetical protein
MDLSNLNFWFFSFKVEPIVTEYSIGRLVWLDANGNGAQEVGPAEPGIANVAYTVYDGPLPGGNVVRTGVTDGNGEFLETGLPAGNYTVVVDSGNFAAAAPLEGLTSTTGGETQNGIEVGLPVCTDTNVPVGCGQPTYNEALFGYRGPVALVPLFVIGDVEPHAIGDTVYFWGAQWWKHNFMSGLTIPGSSRASFKGYANQADVFCGGVWATLPGNSPPPPVTIPDDVPIIVTSKVIKDGPNISGDIQEILIVKHDGKYHPNPGHPGGGPVTSIVCKTL